MHELEDRIKYTFNNQALLDEALTHRSFGTPNNERLEFLGDAVLNLVIGRYLFEQHRDLPEGELTRVRSVLVDQDGLTRISKDLDLGGLLCRSWGMQLRQAFPIAASTFHVRRVTKLHLRGAHGPRLFCGGGGLTGDKVF